MKQEIFTIGDRVRLNARTPGTVNPLRIVQAIPFEDSLVLEDVDGECSGIFSQSAFHLDAGQVLERQLLREMFTVSGFWARGASGDSGGTFRQLRWMDPRHNLIAGAAQVVRYADGAETTVEVVAAQLESERTLERAGGVAYLNFLVTGEVPV